MYPGHKGESHDRWHRGQKVVPRPPRTVPRRGVVQRGQGLPARPYAIKKLAFRPDSPVTIWKSRKVVPARSIDASRTSRIAEWSRAARRGPTRREAGWILAIHSASSA